MPPPVQWGEEPVVRQRLRDGIAGLEMNRRIFAIRFPFAPPQVAELFRTYFGPVNRAFAALDPTRQAELRRDFEQVWSANNRGTDNTTQVAAEYLEIIATTA